MGSPISEAIRLYRNGMSVSNISKELDVSPVTVYKWLQEAGMYTKRNIKRRSVNMQLVSAMLELNGFVKVDSLGTGRKLARSVPGTWLVVINFGVGSIGRKYSSTEFFGSRLPNMHFLVRDSELFRLHISRFLDGLFLEQNSYVSPGMRRAFTHFLNSFGLKRYVKNDLAMVG
ncbi:MAG: helix-turn-helix domain-containing protein [Nitrososphaeria archaeon]